MVALHTTAGLRRTVAHGVPTPAGELIWRTFFVEAERGVSLAAHMPWRTGSAIRTVTLSDDRGQVQAAAVIRPARQPGVVMVGYVCVDAAVRGQGHGRTLMGAVNAAVDAAGCRAALLWTVKPDVYAGQGYGVVGQDEFLRVVRLGSALISPAGFTETLWPGRGDQSGLPTFATVGRRLCCNSAEAIVVAGSRGLTLIDWSGEARDVANLVAAGGAVEWNLNLPTGDAFGDALLNAGYRVERSAGATAMARRSDPSFQPHPVPFIDRI